MLSRQTVFSLFYKWGLFIISCGSFGSCEECGTGNISMLISTPAIKPCRLESIKSSIYAVFKLLLASIISQGNPQRGTGGTPVPASGSLNRCSDRFTRTGVRAPLSSWQRFSLNAAPESVLCCSLVSHGKQLLTVHVNTFVTFIRENVVLQTLETAMNAPYVSNILAAP